MNRFLWCSSVFISCILWTAWGYLNESWWGFLIAVWKKTLNSAYDAVKHT